MEKDLQKLQEQAVFDINGCEDIEELENIRMKYLGRNSILSEQLKNISRLPKDKRKMVGRLINKIKNEIKKKITDKKEELKALSDRRFDPTIPGKLPRVGHLHLITQAIDEISTIFERIGFRRVRYPEVDWDWHVFESLNIPKNHPARDEWETFFVDIPENKKLGKAVLTPHTSNGQVREMERVGKPPIRMINIAKCYRRQSDATHYPMFHQFEGLVIDKDINLAHLKGTIDYFTKQFFGENTKYRIRPFNFKFTEPSFEVDFSCIHCGARGCKFCKSGWHEVGGAGMVHPNVLKAGNIDPQKYSGFAFGWGVERTMMLRPGFGIDDLREIYGTNLDYLKQF